MKKKASKFMVFLLAVALTLSVVVLTTNTDDPPPMGTNTITAFNA